MARVKGAMMTRKHRSKVLGLAKGYWGNKSRHYKMANEQLMKSYSTFMHGLKMAGVDMNRKMLSETAIHDPAAFTALCDMAKKANA